MRKRSMTRAARRIARVYTTWGATLATRVFRVSIDDGACYVEARSPHEAAVRVAGESVKFAIRMERTCWYFRTLERKEPRNVRVYEVCNA